MTRRLFCITFLSAFAVLASTQFVYSQASNIPHDKQYLPKDQYFKALPPEEAIKTIEVPDGYHLQCVASEPMVQEPASFVFDEDGAMYVCEWLTYMQDERGLNQLDKTCRVVKLVDTDGDGVMDKRTVFIDKIRLPRTVLPLKDRVLVNITQETTVWAYYDDNNDGVADRREAAYDGPEMRGNIEHQLSGLVWNLDNYIYSNDMRFRYEKGKLIPERYSKGRISQWGLARDDDGRIYCTWAGGGNPAHSFQFPGGYPILTLPKNVEHAPGYDIPLSICRVEDQSSGHYDFENDRVLKVFSAPCGQTVLRSPLMPEWYGHVAAPEPVGRLIRLSTIKNEDGLRVAHNTFPKAEFIRSTDPFFRPVWSESGPDGCFYFADMYRGIIQEKTWFPHEGNHIWVKRYKRVKEWGMLKVFRHGRIYRLVPNKIKPPVPPKLKNLSTTDLVAQLSSDNGWVRDNAQKLLVYNADATAVQLLKSLFGSSSPANTRIAALWTLDGLKAMDTSLVLDALADKEERICLSGIRLAESYLKAGHEAVSKAVFALAENASPDVAMQLVLSLNPSWPKCGEVRNQVIADHPGHPLIKRYLDAEKQRQQRHLLGDSAKVGHQLFSTHCIVCHGKDGQGVKQANTMLAPPLKNNRWFKERRVDVITRILLKGETGPIDGKTYGEGIMLPFEHTLNDKQIADLINYVGRSWNGWRKPVNASDIGVIRAKVKDRKAPYTSDELLKVK